MVQLLWALGLLLALGYGFLCLDGPVTVHRSAMKTGSTLSLAAISFLEGNDNMLTLALLLGASGDFFLSLTHEQGFLPGLASFFLGHVVYSSMLMSISSGPSGAMWLVFVALVAVSIGLLSAMWPVLGDLRIPVIAYVGVSTTLGVLALGVSSTMVMMGLLMFIISDVILAFWLFLLPEGHKLRPLFSASVWTLYWSGQATILAGFLELQNVSR